MGPPASFPLSGGWQGIQQNLSDLQVGANNVSLAHTPVVSSREVGTGREEERCFPGTYCVPGPGLSPGLDGEERGGWEFSVRRVRATGAHHPTSCLLSLSLSYELQLRGSVISLSGCSQECWKDVVQKACCPGYWGSQCYGTEEAASPAPAPSSSSEGHLHCLQPCSTSDCSLRAMTIHGSLALAVLGEGLEER